MTDEEGNKNNSNLQYKETVLMKCRRNLTSLTAPLAPTISPSVRPNNKRSGAKWQQRHAMQCQPILSVLLSPVATPRQRRCGGLPAGCRSAPDSPCLSALRIFRRRRRREDVIWSEVERQTASTAVISGGRHARYRHCNRGREVRFAR